MSDLASKLPKYEDIPPVEGMPHGCAWNLFRDLFGPDDQLGTLNYLTPDVVKEAGKEIQTGERCQLDWPLDALKYPVPGRKTIEHKLMGNDYMLAIDDEISFNTQSSSQWDGLRHMAHQSTGTLYMGVKHEDVLSGKAGNRLGTQNWVHAGGIVGRGVLLDWLSWYEAQGKPSPNPVSAHQVPVSELIEVAKWQGTEFKFGDILLVRFGFVKWIDEKAKSDPMAIKANVQEKWEFIGTQADKAAFKWLWDSRFAAVASDTMSWEAWPPLDPDLTIHNHTLVLWGMPQGENWNLEGLAKMAKKNKKWSFLLCSAPLHLDGGVATPPNCVAIF